MLSTAFKALTLDDGFDNLKEQYKMNIDCESCISTVQQLNI